MTITEKLIVVVVCIIVICLLIVGYLQAQTPQEVQPYEFAQLEGDVHVYKMVHHGCEIFVVRGHASSMQHSDSVAITTGRGCK